MRTHTDCGRRWDESQAAIIRRRVTLKAPNETTPNFFTRNAPLNGGARLSPSCSLRAGSRRALTCSIARKGQGSRGLSPHPGSWAGATDFGTTRMMITLAKRLASRALAFRVKARSNEIFFSIRVMPETRGSKCFFQDEIPTASFRAACRTFKNGGQSASRLIRR